MRKLILAAILTITVAPFSAHALFGEDVASLLRLVAGQLDEIEQLTKAAGAAEDQLTILKKINDGIGRATSTIQTIDEIARRAKGLDPKSVQRLADLRRVLDEVRDIKSQTEGILLVKTEIADEAISSAAVQSATAYTMGQEMIGTGGSLSQEAATASPGRASQITASSSANLMLAQGVELQTLSQIAQMQAIQLDLQKSLIERDARHELERQDLYSQSVTNQSGTKATKRRAKL